jgi:hypothetical protein
VLLPAGEVPDVAGVPEQCWSARTALHHRVVDTDGEEDCLALWFPLPGEGGLDLLLDPLAGDGGFGEHEQELVVEADRLVNGGADARADGQVVGGEPDAHALGLEV